jgi:hypothetical protein
VNADREARANSTNHAAYPTGVYGWMGAARDIFIELWRAAAASQKDQDTQNNALCVLLICRPGSAECFSHPVHF